MSHLPGLDWLRTTAATRACVLGWVLGLLGAAVLPASSSTTAAEYVCGPFLSGSANFLVALLDPFTGLPYDHLRCECRWESAAGICQSSGVLPQLSDADITPFSEVTPTGDFVEWRFVDDLAGGEDPTLLFALELRLHLSQGNRFGGLIWGATADVSRYDRLRIRYRTAAPTSTFELKLNSGLPGDIRERSVHLAGSPADGSWREDELVIATDFADTDLSHLNYLVLATSLDLAAEPEPTLWVDHIAFLADPARAAQCEVVTDCGGEPDCYPDLAAFEPFTGAVNVANALTALTLFPEVGLLEEAEAEARVERILDSLASTPRVDGWMQDWHSPASRMPDPGNRIGSLTDLPQLYAALMVVEESWPALAAAAASVRRGMLDFTDLWAPAADGACPGELHWAMDLCAGRQEGVLEYYGNDTLLGAFLAVATGAAPPGFWSACLSRQGCRLRGQGAHHWYTTGAFDCAEHEIPAAETGGPFLQLAALTYLTASRLPVGLLSLADSAANMLAAQRQWASSQGLELWGWANHSDADSCDYVTCRGFTPAVATPYVCAMGLDLAPYAVGQACAAGLRAFDSAGAGAPLDSGTRTHDFGLLDAWNQTTGSSREDAYLYLDTGWSALGAINRCRANLVRQRFAGHPVAADGYALLGALGPPCSSATPEPCVQDAHTACLLGGRFQVSLAFRRPSDPAPRQATWIDFSDQGRVFYFTNPANPEMLLKMLDACGPYGRFWVFAAATTNVEFSLTVVDTATGQTNTYHNPQGTAAVPIQDTRAFATCP